MRRRRIEKIPAAIATMSRRAEHLDERITGDRGDSKHRQFDTRELNSIRISIDAMNLAQLFQRPESDPIALLEELIDATDRFRRCDVSEGSQDHDEAKANLLEVQARAKSTVALADAYLDPGNPA